MTNKYTWEEQKKIVKDYFKLIRKKAKLTETKKQERGQQILRQCTREVEQSLAKFGLGLRKKRKNKQATIDKQATIG